MPDEDLSAYLRRAYPWLDDFKVKVEEPKPEPPSDPNYVFVKGQGWVPETDNVKALIKKQEADAYLKKLEEDQAAARQLRQAARPNNFGTFTMRDMRVAPMQQLPRTYNQTWEDLDRWYGARRDYGRQIPRREDAAERRHREIMEEAARVHDAQEYTAYRGLDGTVTRVRNAPQPRYAGYPGAREWVFDTETFNYTYDDGVGTRTVQNTPAPTPQPRTPTQNELAENTGRRYFQGANVAPERARQENQHERRTREYLETRERLRRQRGR